jgi:hypothetical protein
MPTSSTTRSKPANSSLLHTLHYFRRLSPRCTKPLRETILWASQASPLKPSETIHQASWLPQKGTLTKQDSTNNQPPGLLNRSHYFLLPFQPQPLRNPPLHPPPTPTMKPTRSPTRKPPFTPVLPPPSPSNEQVMCTRIRPASFRSHRAVEKPKSSCYTITIATPSTPSPWPPKVLKISSMLTRQ